jgi:hypothetical protein
MNTEYMDVRRGEIMLEFNRCFLCPMLVGKATKRSGIQNYRTPPQLSNLTSPTIARNVSASYASYICLPVVKDD